MTQLKIQYWKIDKLKPYANNAKVHTGQQVQELVNSITRFGFVNPILVDSDGEIIAGHGRYEAAKEMQIEQAPIIVLAGLTAEEKKALRLADNKIQQNTGWDTQVLAAELASLRDVEFELQGIGFSDLELDRLLNQVEDTLPIFSFSENTKTSEKEKTLSNHFDSDDVDEIDDDENCKSDVAFSNQDKYSVFEIAMLEENKIKLLGVLNAVKSENLFEKLEDALMRIIDDYEKMKHVT